MALDAPRLATEMVNAAKAVLSDKWSEIEEYARTELRKLADTLALIERLLAAGRITPEQARLHLEIQKNAGRAVLLTVEGLGVLAAEEALDRALAAVRHAVNTALKFALL